MASGKRRQSSDSKHLLEFSRELEGLNWKDQSDSALKVLFERCVQIICMEIDYYDASRQKHKRISNSTRFMGWIFGSIGFLAPYIELSISKFYGVNGKPGWMHWKEGFFSDLGYLLLGISAVMFTLNSLFGGSSGHMRYVKAQLTLKYVLSNMVLRWQQFEVQDPPISNHERMLYLEAQINEVSDIVLTETQEWEKRLTKDIERYNRAHLPRGSR